MAPRVSELAGSLSTDRVDVSFLVDDPQGDSEVVDVVFRNLVDGEIVVADTVYGSCRRAIALGNGSRTVSCPRIAGVHSALVVVVPFDAAGNWGRGGRCAMKTSMTSFSCAER